MNFFIDFSSTKWLAYRCLLMLVIISALAVLFEGEFQPLELTQR